MPSKRDRLSLSDSIAKLAPDPALAPPLKTQLGTRFIHTKILGFTSDQRAFAVQIDHNYFFGEENQGEFELDIFAVYDTWSGEMIAAFKREVNGSRYT